MASTYLNRNITGAMTGSAYKGTISVWVKRSSLGTEQTIMGQYTNSVYSGRLYFNSPDTLRFQDYWNNQTTLSRESNMKFRDTSGWYHIVCVMDTANSDDADIIIFYVNGERISMTNTNAATFKPLELQLINGGSTDIGRLNTSQYFDGEMSHFHYCDGYAYSPTDFGEYDANGVWKIKTDVSVSYGNAGFFILKDGNSVTDQSGNSNNWSVGGGTLTNTEDSPSNVFATFNALYNSNQNLSNGNLSATNTTSTWNSRASTLAGSFGKYYAEYKVASPGTSYHMNGVGDIDYINPSSHAGAATGSVAYYIDGEIYKENVSSTYGDTYGDGDIIGIALDLDNNYVYFSKNGTWQNSGVPTSGATGTGGIVLPTTGTYAFTESVRSTSSSNAQVDANFGNGYFGTTAVASAGTNASGIGIFEYDVPTGYTALSTKGLNL